MSIGFGCHCEERKKPVEQRNWWVMKRNCRRSAFDGYHIRSSEYSTVICLTCNGCGRTKAAFVDKLKDYQF